MCRTVCAAARQICDRNAGQLLFSCSDKAVTGGPRLNVTAAARHFMDVGGEFEALPEIRQGNIT